MMVTLRLLENSMSAIYDKCHPFWAIPYPSTHPRNQLLHQIQQQGPNPSRASALDQPYMPRFASLQEQGALDDLFQGERLQDCLLKWKDSLGQNGSISPTFQSHCCTTEKKWEANIIGRNSRHDHPCLGPAWPLFFQNHQLYDFPGFLSFSGQHSTNGRTVSNWTVSIHGPCTNLWTLLDAQSVA